MQRGRTRKLVVWFVLTRRLCVHVHKYTHTRALVFCTNLDAIMSATHSIRISSGSTRKEIKKRKKKRKMCDEFINDVTVSLISWPNQIDFRSCYLFVSCKLCVKRKRWNSWTKISFSEIDWIDSLNKNRSVRLLFHSNAFQLVQYFHNIFSRFLCLLQPLITDLKKRKTKWAKRKFSLVLFSLQEAFYVHCHSIRLLRKQRNKRDKILKTNKTRWQ